MVGEEDRWYEKLVRDVFDGIYVEAILQTPLRRSNNKDCHFSSLNLKGVFSVKNAYRVMRTQLIEEKIVADAQSYHKYRDLERSKAL